MEIENGFDFGDKFGAALVWYRSKNWNFAVFFNLASVIFQSFVESLLRVRKENTTGLAVSCLGCFASRQDLVNRTKPVFCDQN